MKSLKVQQEVYNQINTIHTKNISFRLVEEKDAKFINRIRNDKTINTHLPYTDNNIETQKNWIKEYIGREAQGLEYYFIIQYKNEDIGVIRIYSISDGIFTWGSWIIINDTIPSAALESAILLYKFAFDVLNLDHAVFDVRQENKSVNSFHIKIGAEFTHETELDKYYIFTRDSYLKLLNRYKRYL